MHGCADERFASDEQRSAVIRLLLGAVGQDNWWARLPTADALGQLAERGRWSESATGQMLRVAFDLWNGTGQASLDIILSEFDDALLGRLGSLLVAMSLGPEAVDLWLAEQTRGWGQHIGKPQLPRKTYPTLAQGQATARMREIRWRRHRLLGAWIPGAPCPYCGGPSARRIPASEIRDCECLACAETFTSTSRRNEICGSCGATRAEIEAGGHRSIAKQYGSQRFSVYCPEGCTCTHECFSAAEHDRAYGDIPW